MSAAWKNTKLTVIALSTCPVLVFAQGVMSGPGSTPAQQPQTINVPQQSTQFESETLLVGADRVFDTDSDSIDFEEGGFNWKGRSFNLGDSRLVRARFERYLASPLPSENAAEYLQLLDSIEKQLQVNNLRLNTEILQDLWNLLFEAAEYQMDGGSSLIVANQVANAWRDWRRMKLAFNTT